MSQKVDALFHSRRIRRPSYSLHQRLSFISNYITRFFPFALASPIKPNQNRIPLSTSLEPRKLHMAASISTSAYPLLTSDRSNRLAANASSSSRFSSSSSLHLPLQLQRVRLGNSRISAPSRSRSFPVVKAKNQTFSSFDDLLANSDKPVLVDFYATWCGPCQFMVPILEQVSATLIDKVQVVKIDTEKYPAIADKYRIEALPTFILFKDGKPLDRFEGALAARELIQRIEDSLKVKQ